MLKTDCDPQAVSQNMQQQDLVRFKMQMDGLKSRLAGQDQKKELKDACVQFEAVFINQLWKEMRKSVPKEGYLHSPMEEQYLSMFDSHFSEQMAKDGGVGLADVLYDSLKDRVEEAAHRTLGSGGEGDAKALKAEAAGLPLNRDDQGIPLDPRSAAARAWDDARREVDPARAEAEVMQEVEALAQRITGGASRVESRSDQADALAERILSGSSGGSETARRRAMRSYAAEDQVGRHIAENL